MGAAALTFICVMWLKGDEGYAHVNALNDLVWGVRRNENAALLSPLALKSCVGGNWIVFQACIWHTIWVPEYKMQRLRS